MDDVAKEIRSFKRWFIIVSILVIVPYLVMTGAVIYTSYSAYNTVKKIEKTNISESINVNLEKAIEKAVNAAVQSALGGK